MRRPRPLGAHPITPEWEFAVLRVSGVIAVLWSLLMGFWILRHQGELFDTPAWVDFVDFIGGNKAIVGWIILGGGILGLIGLAFELRPVSVASCVIGIGWCGWLAAFLWVATPNVGAGFSILGAFVFILRFWLLYAVPRSDDDVVAKGG